MIHVGHISSMTSVSAVKVLIDSLWMLKHFY